METYFIYIVRVNISSALSMQQALIRHGFMCVYIIDIYQCRYRYLSAKLYNNPMVEELLSPLRDEESKDREVQQFPQGHTASECQNWVANSLVPESMHLTTMNLKSMCVLCFHLSRIIYSRHSEKRAKSHDIFLPLITNNKSFLKSQLKTLALYTVRKIYHLPQVQQPVSKAQKQSAADQSCKRSFSSGLLRSPLKANCFRALSTTQPGTLLSLPACLFSSTPHF